MTVILYVKCHFFNPSYHPVLFRELQKRSDENFILVNVTGYELKQVEQIINKADLVVIDHSLYSASKYSRSSISFNLLRIKDYRGNIFYSAVWDYVLSSDKRILYVASLTDLHAMNSTRPIDGFGEKFNELINRIEGIAWGFPNRMISKTEVPEKYYDKWWMNSYDDPQIIWQKIMKAVKVNIDLQHCLDSSEILQKKVNKKWQVAVPGETYATRKIAFKAAQSEKLQLAPYKFSKLCIQKPTNALFTIGVKEPTAKFTIKVIKSLQDYILTNSSISFTCGSGYRYFVRKYLEIPSKKAVLLSYPFTGSHNYGFINGINCIEVEPEQVGREAKFLLARPALIETLIENATKLLVKNHTAEARVNQFKSAIDLMEKGKLVEAKFTDGEFTLTG